MSAEPQEFSIEQAYEDAKAEQSATTEPSESLSPPSTEVAQPDEAAAAPPDTTPADSESPDLISDAEYQALKDSHKDDPDALVKALKGTFTKKTQALAEERKSLETVKAYKPFIDALVGADTPEKRAAVLRQAATELGVDLSAVASPKAETADAVQNIADVVREKLGPDYEFMSGPLGHALEAALAPLQAKLDALSSVGSKADAAVQHIAQQQVSETMAAIDRELPDWRQYEAAMVELGLPAKQGESPLDYAKRAYRIVTLEQNYDARVAADVKKSIEQMRKGAKASERQIPAAPAHRVAKESTASTIEEMWEEAKSEVATR